MWRRWTCWRLRPRLVDVAAGTLDASQRARVASHLSRCGQCAAEVAALREVPRLLRGAEEQPLLREAEEPPLGEEFWRRQRAAIMRSVEALDEGHTRSARVSPWSPLDGRRRRPTWAPVLVAAAVVMLVIGLQLGPPWPPRPEVPATGVDALDDPTLLSLSDLAGNSSADMERTAGLAEDAGPLRELSNEEVDALAQLVGVRER